MTHLRSLVITGFTALMLAACGGDENGSLSIAVTDAPIDDATAVVVTFTGIELQPQGGGRITIIYDTPRQIDLLALQGGLTSPLLTDQIVPAGDYAWIRLMVDSGPGSTASYITLSDTTVHPLYVPSGDETGLKLNGGMTVAAGGSSDFTVDFDLRKSVNAPSSGTDYKLRPTLRLVDDLQVGAIAGSVSAALITVGCSPAVYAYTGVVTPNDVGSAVPPMSSALVVNGGYMLAFMSAGTYTVAFTCEALADAPDTDDAIAFGPVASATVVAGATTTLNIS